MKMTIDSMKVGEIYELDAHNSSGERVVLHLEVLEVGLYPSEVKPGTFYQGAKVRINGADETVLDFISLEGARKV